MDSVTKALHLFTRWHDGSATDAELISGLAELPGVAGAMPDGETKDQVLRLREEVRSRERAAKGSVAARAMTAAADA